MKMKKNLQMYKHGKRHYITINENMYNLIILEIQFHITFIYEEYTSTCMYNLY